MVIGEKRVIDFFPNFRQIENLQFLPNFDKEILSSLPSNSKPFPYPFNLNFLKEVVIYIRITQPLSGDDWPMFQEPTYYSNAIV